MFGYVRVLRDTLPEEALAGYEAMYCGLCRRMGKRYGSLSRLFLNYDFTFLAMLLAPEGELPAAPCGRCPRHPIVGKCACDGGDWLDTAAGESLILAYWKLRDTVADSGFLASLPARLLSLFLAPGYRRARADHPDFDAQVVRRLGELDALEKADSPSIDRTADCFAWLLRLAAPGSGEDGRDRALGELLYHLGWWIYLIDAVDDLEEDRRRERYNPILARFPRWTEEDRAYLRKMLDHDLALAGAAYQLLPPNAYAPVVENIIYSGLPAVEELVFSGKWREHQTRHGRNDL